ncbi:hypothetical protein D1AOALGA4SA_9548 [Olavius algarvensis Delta 1 endosymbiont]|nr:hypothetical protein D1AOALGA4SA_9548 [Olavius algarvensis Delta 1 endosymbiont]
MLIKLVAENLVVWARSETIGCAVNPAMRGKRNDGISQIRRRRTGMLEGWV